MKTLLLSAILFAPIMVFASVPDFPMAFWGTATVDGAAASAGSVVRVYDEQTKVGESVVQSNGVYGYTEPTKQKLVVGEGNGVLTFTIQVDGGVETQGLSVITYPGFESGETIHKDLNFTTKSTVTSGGSSSGGGGGGGGSKSKKKVTTETDEMVLGAATSTLSEEENKIALQKQIIVLLTQLIVLLQMKTAL